MNATLRVESRPAPAASGRSLPLPVVPAPLPPPRDALADVHRGFFTAAILVILTAGASWGVWLLFSIGFARSFTGVSIHAVNAHGHAQIFGWVALFIMGFAYQVFPRMWRSSLAAPRLATAVLGLMVGGLFLSVVANALPEAGAWVMPAILLGGGMELAAVVAFAGQMALTLRRGRAARARIEPYVAFILGAIAWLVLMTGMSLWHTAATVAAPDRAALLKQVATYQAALRDVQIHGLALFMILGVSIRALPGMFGLKDVSDRRAWWAFGLLAAGVLGEVVLLILSRVLENMAFAAALMLPWIMLAAGVWLVAGPWRFWRPLPRSDRAGKFVRAAYGWLAVSLGLLLLLPAYQALYGMGAFSHAYYGAIRHAITVGFISQMIVGVSAKMVPGFRGVSVRELPGLVGPFVLINLGCAMRVVTQILTDWSDGLYAVIGFTGVLELSGLAWWGAHILGLLWRGRPRPAPRPRAAA